MSNRSWTADEALFTFCPPGPGARMNSNVTSASSIERSGVISIFIVNLEQLFG